MGLFFRGGLGVYVCLFFKEREFDYEAGNKNLLQFFFSYKASLLALQTTSGTGAVCRQPRRGVPQPGEVLLQHWGQSAAGVKVRALSPFQRHWQSLNSFVHQFRVSSTKTALIWVAGDSKYVPGSSTGNAVSP